MQQSYYRPVPTPSQGPSEPQSQLQTHTLDTVPAWVDERQDANHGLSADTSPDLPLTTIRRPPSIPPYLQPPYGFYRAYSPYFNTSIPAARGYLPQRLQQESRPVSRGPRAVPLRISRYAANLSSSGPRPVPTLSLPLERPYSVPTYPNQHTNGGNDDGITPPLRPATSSEVDDIDKLVPPRPLVFPQRRAAQEGRNAPHALRKGSVEDAKPAQKTPSTRAVAKRGSKKPAPASVSCGMETVPSKPSTTSAVSPDKLAEPQKRPIGSTEPESNPVKKSKINVIGGQFESITPPGRSVDSLEKVSSTADPLTQEALSTTQGRRQAGRGDDDTTVTGSDVEEETTTTMLADVQSVNTPLEAQETSTTNETGGLNDTSAPNHGDTSHRRAPCPRYSNASAQCDTAPELASSATQTEREASASAFRAPTPTVASTPNGDASLAERSSTARLGAALRLQRDRGMDGFIETRLSAAGGGGAGALEALTNEILLGMVMGAAAGADDDDDDDAEADAGGDTALLDQVLEIMQA